MCYKNSRKSINLSMGKSFIHSFIYPFVYIYIFYFFNKLNIAKQFLHTMVVIDYLYCINSSCGVFLRYSNFTVNNINNLIKY